MSRGNRSRSFEPLMATDGALIRRKRQGAGGMKNGILNAEIAEFAEGKRSKYQGASDRIAERSAASGGGKDQEKYVLNRSQPRERKDIFFVRLCDFPWPKISKFAV